MYIPVKLQQFNGYIASPKTKREWQRFAPLFSFSNEPQETKKMHFISQAT
jgi:hypothetical protein